MKYLFLLLIICSCNSGSSNYPLPGEVAYLDSLEWANVDTSLNVDTYPDTLWVSGDTIITE